MTNPTPKSPGSPLSWFSDEAHRRGVSVMQFLDQITRENDAYLAGWNECNESGGDARTELTESGSASPPGLAGDVPTDALVRLRDGLANVYDRVGSSNAALVQVAADDLEAVLHHLGWAPGQPARSAGASRLNVLRGPVEFDYDPDDKPSGTLVPTDEEPEVI